MSESVFSKIPYKIVGIWFILIIILYSFFFSETSNSLESSSYIAPSKLVDAIVFISMGKMVEDPMVDYSIASVRKLGKWRGEIYVITDNPQCYTDSVRDFKIITIEVPPAVSIIEIKSLKPRLMSFMPDHVSGILYIDVDILVTKNLMSFFQDLGSMVTSKKINRLVEEGGQIQPSSVRALTEIGNTTFINNPQIQAAQSSPHHSGEETLFDFGAFPDAKGHYVGWCAGCEKWHSGVMWLRRGHGERCLEKWRSVLLSGMFDTDQQSLDYAENNGSCRHALTLPTRHLLFAKDYIAMMLTSGQTFIHVTAAGRKEDTDYFYREIVIPRLRSSLHPPLNPHSLNHRKQCMKVVAATNAPTK